MSKCDFKVTRLKSHFDLNVLLQIWCIFSGHLFLKHLWRTASAEAFAHCPFLFFLIKLQTPAQVFSCEYCEIKNTYFVEQLRTAASEHRIYIFFFVLILRQNRYLPLNSDDLLGKQRTMLRYGSQPSKISYLRFSDVFYFLH